MVSQENLHDDDIILYRFLRDSFNRFLLDHHLLYHYDVHPTSPVVDVISRIMDDMSRSDSSYRFSSPNRALSWMSHETLPLELLGLVNKGSPRGSDNQVRLRRMPLNASTTLQALVSDRSNYANPNVCIEDDRYVINLSECIRQYKSAVLIAFQLFVIILCLV